MGVKSWSISNKLWAFRVSSEINNEVEEEVEAFVASIGTPRISGEVGALQSSQWFQTRELGSGAHEI